MQWILCFGNQRRVQTHLYISKKEHLRNGKNFFCKVKSALFRLRYREFGRRTGWVLSEWGRELLGAF